MLAALAMAAAASLLNGAVFVFETAGQTRYYYDSTSIHVTNEGRTSLRSARIISVSPAERRDSQVAGEAIMQLNCAKLSFRQLRSYSIKPSGKRVEVVHYDPARLFEPTKPGSMERKLVTAVCQAAV